jgi:lysine 6-dehydrogenase
LKVAVVGTGLMGSAAVWDLMRSEGVDEVVAIDSDREKLQALRARHGSERLTIHPMDVRDRRALYRRLSGCHVAIGALPHQLAEEGIWAAVEAGVHYVDLIFMWAPDLNVWRRVDELAQRAGITIISPCGLAPGLTNILAYHAHSLQDKTREIRIYVGGIPRHPRPPLNYRIVFSPDSLWDLYTRPARVVESGRLITVEPLTGLETLRVAGVGTLEAFYTDGLSTLPETVKGVERMFEKTLRWPGHAAQVRTLIECGLLSTEPVGGDIPYSPRELTTKILLPRLMLGGEEDLTVLRVEAVGEYRGQTAIERFQMVDFYDRSNGISSMARTTAYPASVAAQLLAMGYISRRGFCPPETVFTGDLLRTFMNELRRRGIRITHRRIRGG